MFIFQKLKKPNKNSYDKFQQEFNKILEKAISTKTPKNAKAIVAKFLERREIISSQYLKAIRKELAANPSSKENLEEISNMMKEAEPKINYQCQNELDPNEREIFISYMSSLKSKILSLVMKYSTDEYTASQLLDYLDAQQTIIIHKREYFSSCLQSSSNPQVDEAITTLDVLNSINKIHIPSEEEAKNELTNCAIKEEIISICHSLIFDRQKKVNFGRK